MFAEAVMLDDGHIIRLGRIGMTRGHLEAFARTLTHDDHVVIEATGNATAVSEALAPHVGRVVIANPRQVHLIAKAHIKTDVIDATVLARLCASDFLPAVWVPEHGRITKPGRTHARTMLVEAPGKRCVGPGRCERSPSASHPARIPALPDLLEQNRSLESNPGPPHSAERHCRS